MDWQNLFGPSKNYDKICLGQIFNFSSVGAHTAKYLLTASVNHAEINTIACALLARKVTWDLTSDGLMANFNASIEYVASAYYGL